MQINDTERLPHRFEYFVSEDNTLHLGVCVYAVYHEFLGLFTCCGKRITLRWTFLPDHPEGAQHPMCLVCDKKRDELHNHFSPVGNEWNDE